jgi:hypothetical protein
VACKTVYGESPGRGVALDTGVKAIAVADVVWGENVSIDAQTPLKSDTDEPSALGRKLSVVFGELVQTTAGKWITHPPTRCPNGHTLGAGQVLVGHQACSVTAAGTPSGH